MPKQYILALDQGTTSSRAIVFDHGGRIVPAAQKEFEQILPSPGLVEHDPEVIWASQIDVAREAIDTARLRPKISRPSASPTNARRPSFGNARPVGPSPTRSSGRAA